MSNERNNLILTRQPTWELETWRIRILERNSMSYDHEEGPSRKKVSRENKGLSVSVMTERGRSGSQDF